MCGVSRMSMSYSWMRFGVHHSHLAGIPLLAGFPLTDVQLGRSFAVTSGHQPEATDWTAFLRVDTLVVLMAGKNLDVLMRLLLSAGWAPDRAVSHITVSTISTYCTCPYKHTAGSA